MDKQRIQDEAEAFFEWPTADKTYVTTTSMLIFTSVIARMAAEEAVRATTKPEEQRRSILQNRLSHRAGLPTPRWRG